MAKRRDSGDGSIYERHEKGCPTKKFRKAGCRCPERFVGQVDNGHYASGRRKYIRVVRSTRDEVRTEVRKLTAKPGRVLDGSIRLDAFLDEWLEHLATVGGRSGRPVAANTVAKYTWSAGRIKAHRIAKLRLRDIRPRDVQALIGASRRELADSSVSDVKTALSTALAWAVLDDRIDTNPAREVAVYQTKRGKLDDRFTPDESATVLAAAEDEAWGVAAVLGLKLGLRIGEVCGLRWSDIDEDASELRIRRTITKSDDGAGKLPLLDDVADALKARRRHQAKERLEAGPLWTDTGYIVTGARGRPVDPSTLRRWWNGLLRDAGIAHRCGSCDDPAKKCSTTSVRRFHAARHSVATNLLDDGVPIEVVSAICRHSDIVITTKIYAEVTKDSMRRSLGKLGKASGD